MHLVQEPRDAGEEGRELGRGFFGRFDDQSAVGLGLHAQRGEQTASDGRRGLRGSQRSRCRIGGGRAGGAAVIDRRGFRFAVMGERGEVKRFATFVAPDGRWT